MSIGPSEDERVRGVDYLSVVAYHGAYPGASVLTGNHLSVPGALV